MTKQFEDVIVHAQRIEEVLAVKYDPNDSTVEAVIRGWVPSIPEHAPLSEIAELEDGKWVVKHRATGNTYILTEEQFNEGFKVVAPGKHTAQ